MRIIISIIKIIIVKKLNNNNEQNKRERNIIELKENGKMKFFVY
jgi:hypothetical protein